MPNAQGTLNLKTAIGSMIITDHEFDQIRSLIYDRFGISLSDGKRALVVGRLQKLLKTEGIKSFRDYYGSIISDTSGRVLSRFVNRITTNYTYFNREQAHFEFFSKTALPEVIADLKEKKEKDLRVWCAACSTGEAPYMLVMLMHEFFGNRYSAWDAGILATDISSRAISVAKAGIYADERVKQIPERLTRRYLERIRDGDWSVSEGIKREVCFRRFNLMNTVFPFKKAFDIIFCRNVMIYFDQETREQLIKRFHQFTKPGGYLFIGHSETLGRKHALYKNIIPAVYRKEAD